MEERDRFVHRHTLDLDALLSGSVALTNSFVRDAHPCASLRALPRRPTIAPPPRDAREKRKYCMPKLYVIAVSTRPTRAGFPLSTWMFERARAHGGFDVELVDLKQEALPMFDEPHHPRLRQYEHEHTQRWSKKIDAADAFIFVTPEYDHAAPPSLINALIYLVHEWAHKPVGFVSYGGPAGGIRAVQMLKPMLTALKMVVLLESVMAPLFASSIDQNG